MIVICSEPLMRREGDALKIRGASPEKSLARLILRTEQQNRAKAGP